MWEASTWTAGLPGRAPSFGCSERCARPRSCTGHRVRPGRSGTECGTCPTYGINHEYTYDVSGPDHLKSYTATIELRDARDQVHRWTERLPGTPGKPEAKKATVEAVLDILATPVNGVIDDPPARERDLLAFLLLAFLLRAQLDGLGRTTERQRTRILARGDLGTDLLTTGDTNAFLAWAERVRPCSGRTARPYRTHCASCTERSSTTRASDPAPSCAAWPLPPDPTP
ncbi:hypothetical protein OG936_39460 (plasmid) [Streptomyces sp. NBC_00846]|uniref:hypothetical protein n=1 Tax=Streptomyces sp. NBC_00846 TaxID=2975849 RepID=UPI002F9189E8|nr:hypothetical protein OG936_39460 [Streptomyces sp. NBC_00846]